MKKIISSLMALTLLLLMFAPQSANAAGSVKVATYKYKSQPYIQVINHPNKTVSSKINKALKAHAVQAASASKGKEIVNNNGWYKTSVKTMYNKNNKLSVVYDTSAYYGGGAHDAQWSTTYNFDTRTGKQITLNEILNSRAKIIRANQYVDYILELKNSKGNDIYDTEPTINIKKGSFYFKDNGVTVVFDIYEIAAYYVGRVDINIPHEIINGTKNIPTVKSAQQPVVNTNKKPPESLQIDTSAISVYSNDRKIFLGNLSTNIYDSDSIFNKYGSYGSKYTTNSIWNEYGTYGSNYSVESAFNKYTTTPPVLVFMGEVIGYVTTNEYTADGISPFELMEFTQLINSN